MTTTAMRESLPRVIGLCGYGGAGKDETARILTRLYGYQQRAFANKLREFATALDAYIPEMEATYTQTCAMMGYEGAKAHRVLYTDGTVRTPVRDHLVRIGEVCRRVFAEDFWIDLALKTTPDSLLVVSDVRYPNESRRIHEMGGVVWLVERPGCEAKHETERLSIAETPCDATLYNDGTLQDLEFKIYAMLRRYDK